MRTYAKRLIAWIFLCLVLFAEERPITNIVATSAANYEPGLPPRGSVGAIFCVGLEGVEGVVTAGTVPLPRELAGVRVTIGGASAPLFAVANLGGYYQINAQTPQEAKLDETVDPPRAEVRIEQFAATDIKRLAFGVITALTRPKPGDVFMATIESGSSATEIHGQPLIFRASDFSLITRNNPARPKDTLVLYATGLAPTEPVVPTGEAAPANPPASIPSVSSTIPPGLVRGTMVTATIAVEQQFIGLAPGLIGVYQVNFTLTGTGTGYDGSIYVNLLRVECPGAIATLATCRESSSTHWRSKAVLVPYKPD